MDLYLASAATIVSMMVVLWLISLRLQDSSIVDIFWGPGFIVVAAVATTAGEGYAPRTAVALGLVSAWGLRLGVHIFLRNRGSGEDRRYTAWRRRYADRWWWVSLYRVFLLQGTVMWIVSLPLLAAGDSPAPASLGPVEVAGIVLWTAGFAFETIGDLQLARFRSDPDTHGVMDRGLWRYTRHPNYFGDALVWWGLGLIALRTPSGPLALIGPALMTFLLVRVSGVAMLEQHMSNRPGYAEYVRRTSSFVPRPPKRQGI